MLSVAGADHIITMDLHASQIQVSLIYFYIPFVTSPNFVENCQVLVLTFIDKKIYIKIGFVSFPQAVGRIV